MPGVGAGGVLGVPKFIIRLQLGRGQAILRDDSLHTNKQLQGHRTYFLPGGAGLIGWKKFDQLRCSYFCLQLY